MRGVLATVSMSTRPKGIAVLSTYSLILYGSASPRTRLGINASLRISETRAHITGTVSGTYDIAM